MNRKIMLLAAMLSAVACEDFLGEGNAPDTLGTKGELSWQFSEGTPALTKAAEEFPDTNDFILKVTAPDGSTLYEGSYGASPEKMLVSEGSYGISVRSGEFSAPKFAAPLYGDDQIVMVSAGTSTQVKLHCSLLNCGIRLRIASDFLSSYPGGALFVKSTDGRLPFSYSEKRVAYFNPGSVSVTMTDNSSLENTLLTRTLAAREILQIGISAPSSSSSGGNSSPSMKIDVDTTKYWSGESFVIGGGDSSGNDMDKALSIAEARSMAPATDVWVYGYIVGGDLTSAGTTVKTSEITKNTHIAIAARSSVTEKASCIAVELPKGKVRDALNLVEHPSNIGKKVYVRGDLVTSYFGTTGLKSTDEYSF